MESGTGTGPVAVHVIDDDDSFRRSMTRMLTAAGFVAAGYRCAAEFLIEYKRTGSTCILLDISMPGPSGIDLLKALAARESSPPVIFVTGRDDVLTTIDVMKWGAFSYLLKPISSETLLPVVRAALQADEQRRTMRLDLVQLRTRFAALTPAERTIFDGVVNNRLNKQLAAELGVCERTVKAQRARMFEKLQVQTVPELVRVAQRLESAAKNNGTDAAAWPWFGSPIKGERSSA